MGGKPSTEGDVYSYGILLLEMFTEKRPTDDIFKDGLDLYNFVYEMNSPEQVMMIIYPSLNEENRDLTECLISIFRIGLKCSTTLPTDRMNMNEVMRELLHIKDAFFSARRQPL